MTPTLSIPLMLALLCPRVTAGQEHARAGEIERLRQLVERAVAASRALGIEPRPTISSTDASVPISRGVPAITIGEGGVGIGSHSPDERFVNEQGPLGIQRALLILLAQAGLARTS